MRRAKEAAPTVGAIGAAKRNQLEFRPQCSTRLAGVQAAKAGARHTEGEQAGGQGPVTTEGGPVAEQSTGPGPASITMTLEEWLAEGRRLFGDDQLQWRFVCPICGNVQSPNDFRQYQGRGATPASAYQECIGRYLPKAQCGKALADGPRVPERPCDYAAFGLFRVGPVQVQGHSYPIFDFDRRGNGRPDEHPAGAESSDEH